MDTKLIEYMIKIADEGSITKAAEKLFITQSALSQQLQKLEKEVGTPLFIRNKAAWAPTPEGQIYLENAREMLRIKQKTYTVEPRERSVKQQQEAIHKGELDIGFVTLTDAQKTGDEYIDLYKEEIYLALPADYPLSKEYLHSDDKYPTVPLTAFQYEPFVMMYKESTIRKMVDQIFRDAGFTPTVLFETSSNMTILSMIKAHLACGLLPYHYVKQEPEGVRFFRFPFRPTWKVCVTYPKNAYLSKAAKDFIELVTEYWTKE